MKNTYDKSFNLCIPKTKGTKKKKSIIRIWFKNKAPHFIVKKSCAQRELF